MTRQLVCLLLSSFFIGVEVGEFLSEIRVNVLTFGGWLTVMLCEYIDAALMM